MREDPFWHPFGLFTLLASTFVVPLLMVVCVNLFFFAIQTVLWLVKMSFTFAFPVIIALVTLELFKNVACIAHSSMCGQGARFPKCRRYTTCQARTARQHRSTGDTDQVPRAACNKACNEAQSIQCTGRSGKLSASP